jgi:signal transduction histidine kinase
MPGAERLVRLVARVPATVHAKLLAAFLAIVVLLVGAGVVGLQVLSGANRRAEDLVRLQRKIGAYRQLQHDTIGQLYGVASALLAPDEETLDAALRQLKQFGYDLDRLQYVAKDEVAVFGQAQVEYQKLIDVVGRAVDLIRQGKRQEGLELQLRQAAPLADRLERLMNQLVNRAEVEMLTSLEAGRAADLTSRAVVIGFGAGSILLALLLGFVISWSLIGPVKRMETRFSEIAAGDFAHPIEVPNRDELGAMAANLNRMSDELGRLHRQLEAASQHKSRFLASMSHELRTPLNAIIGYTDLILDGVYGAAPQEIREVLERVQRSGRHLLGLINDVLDLSKIEAGQLTLAVQEYALPEIVQAAVSAVHSLADEKRLVLSVDLAPDLPRGTGDPRRLTQVLLNLVGNAIKFTDQGDVRVRAAADSGQFVVTVADTGPGIAEADRRRIFEEFQQAGPPNGGPRGGTGLGLAIARRIVELHGGRIGVDSQVGHGATFWFTVPVRAGREAAAP